MIAALSEHQVALLDYLKGIKGLFPPTTPRKHNSTESLVLSHGQWFEPRPKPAGIKRGKPKHCFANAYALADLDFTGVVYVEGFAVGGGLFPVHHAWCIDAENNVIENTWDAPGTAYYGVPLDMEFIYERARLTEVYGVFGLPYARDLCINGLPVEAIHERHRVT